MKSIFATVRVASTQEPSKLLPTFITSLLTLGLIMWASAAAFGQGSAFTYQGKLADTGMPANGNYDFEFKLFDTAAVGTGTQQGSTVQRINIPVANGIFTVSLDFGSCASCFNGSDRFLEIEVKPTSGGTFATLGPRQPITAAPYALRSVNATTADGLSLTCINCVTSSQIQNVQGSQIIGNIAGSQISGTVPVASIPPGSGNYVQNGTTQQASSNFNVSGDGTAGGSLSGNIVNATSQYNLGGSRFIAVTGVSPNFNTAVGLGAGALNTGSVNSYFGTNAGANNTTGGQNSFFGGDAGEFNTTGINNSFFGLSAGRGNSTGSNSSFFGTNAGSANNGNNNAFFGSATGIANTTGSDNAFFGMQSGRFNMSGTNNTFIGRSAGFNNGSGGNNSFFGFSAGLGNGGGSNNTAMGANSNVSTFNLDHATAIGADAIVSASNTVALGRSSGADAVLVPGNLTINGTLTATLPTGSGNYIQNTTTQQATSNFNISGNGTAGGLLSANMVSVATQYNLGVDRMISGNAAKQNTFVGVGAGLANPSGLGNTVMGYSAGLTTADGTANSFFGAFAGNQNVSGFSNSFFGYAAGSGNTNASLNSFFGANAGSLNAGAANSFFGDAAGNANGTGSSNSFFGHVSGNHNTTGNENTFVGYRSGFQNTQAGNNSFFGSDAGFNTTTGSNNTMLGSQTGAVNVGGSNLTLVGAKTDLGSNSLTNATAIGYQARVDQSNSLSLGSVAGINSAIEDTKVGIGTTTPGVVLDVQRDGGTIPETIRVTTYGTDNEILSRASGGSRTSPTATPANRNLLVLGGTGHEGTNFASNPGATINIVATETWSSMAHGSRVSFGTTANGTTGLVTRMTVNNDGNVGVGTTTPLDLLDVNGDIRVGDTGTNGCLKNNNGGTIIGTCVSDARFKQRITPVPGGVLSRFAQLRPVSFYWRADEYPNMHFGEGQEVGLIAQEVERILPELVSSDQQGFKAIHYSRLPLLTIQAIKELKAENDAQKKQSETLQAQNASLERRLTAQIEQQRELKRIVCMDHPKAKMCKP